MTEDGARAPVPLRRSSPPAVSPSLATKERRRGPGAEAPPSSAVPQMPTFPALDSEYLDPEKKLNTVLEMVARAHEEWQEAVRIADEFGAGWLPKDEQYDAETRREEARLNVRKA